MIRKRSTKSYRAVQGEPQCLQQQKDRHKAEVQNKETMMTNINTLDRSNQLEFVKNVQKGP